MTTTPEIATEEHRYVKCNWDADIYICTACNIISKTDDRYYGNADVTCQEVLESGIHNTYPEEPLYSWKRRNSSYADTIILMPKCHMDRLDEAENSIFALRENLSELREGFYSKEKTLLQELSEESEELENLILEDIGTDNIIPGIWRERLDLARQIKSQIDRNQL